MKRRTAVSALALAAAGPSWAQGDRPMRVVIGYPPGGASDNMSRALSRGLADRLQRTVIVDNRPGANTVIAAKHVYEQKGDGQTLFHVDASTLTLIQFLYPSIGFDPASAFTPIARTSVVRLGLAVPATSRMGNLREFVAAARTGRVNVASAGAGNITHIALELFKRHTGVELTHVPYKGSAQALQDVMSGQVDAYFSDIPSCVQHVRSGRIKLLGVMADARLAELPDVPTFAEAGVPNFQVVSWFGVVGPPQMPSDLVTRLSAAIKASIEAPAMADWMKSNTFELNYGSPDEFARMVKSEADTYGKVIREIGLKLE